MSKKRYIDTNFWSDTWVDSLSKHEKLFFLYLLTNERTTIAGIYEIPMKRIMLETEFDKVEIAKMFKRMENKVRYIDGWIVLRNAIKAQNYRNDKIKRGIKAILETCPVELLQHMDVPKDIDIVIQRSEPEPKQQRLIDDSSVIHDDSYMIPEAALHLIKYNTNSNSIESNTNAAKPQESSKELSKSQKRSYAIAMDNEREQTKRASESFSRKPSKPGTIMTQAEVDAMYEKRTIRK